MVRGNPVERQVLKIHHRGYGDSREYLKFEISDLKSSLRTLCDFLRVLSGEKNLLYIQL